MPVPDSDRLVGQLGLVTMRVGGGSRPGEVQLPIRGGSETFLAYSAEPIDAGSQVLVLARRPGRAVEVTAFDG